MSGHVYRSTGRSEAAADTGSESSDNLCVRPIRAAMGLKEVRLFDESYLGLEGCDECDQSDDAHDIGDGHGESGGGDDHRAEDRVPCELACSARTLAVPVRIRRSAHQVADLIDDPLGSGQELVRLDRAEIGEVGCVATIDDPWVEDVEILRVDVRRAGWWVARV